MNDQEKTQFVEMLQATLEIYGTKLTQGAISIWVAALSEYSLKQLRGALSDYVKTAGTGHFAPKPADLIELLAGDDGRPGAEEAWALCPMSEWESAYWTDETARAFGAGAADMVNRGDTIGARMAFREVYTRYVSDARANKIPINWFLSQGYDKHDRDVKMSQAISLGRVSLARAKEILPMLEYHQEPGANLKLVS